VAEEACRPPRGEEAPRNIRIFLFPGREGWILQQSPATAKWRRRRRRGKFRDFGPGGTYCPFWIGS